jgi:hypothetical protein
MFVWKIMYFFSLSTLSNMYLLVFLFPPPLDTFTLVVERMQIRNIWLLTVGVK